MTRGPNVLFDGMGLGDEQLQPPSVTSVWKRCAGARKVRAFHRCAKRVAVFLISVLPNCADADVVMDVSTFSAPIYDIFQAALSI